MDVCPSIGRPGGTGANPWVAEVLRFGYCIPFLQVPPLSKEPIPMASYSRTSTKGITLEKVTLSLVEKGAVELAPLPSPGFYSWMFVVWKTSWSWRPVIDLSVFNRFLLKTLFKMVTIQSVLLSVGQGDWMGSIDLKEAYLQVPVHPDGLWPSASLTSFGLSASALHCSPGLHQGYDSNRNHSPQSRHSYASIPRRLAYSSQFSWGSSPGSQYCSLSLSGVGGCSKPGKIELRPSSEGSISRYSSRCPDFQGFSVPGAHRQAYVSWRRISVLQAAARVHLAVSFGNSVLSLPSCSRGIASASQPSNSLYIARGIAWRIPFWSPGRTTASRIFVGGWTPNVFFGGCLCLNSHPTSTSGPTRQTSAGVLTSVTKSFQASGLRRDFSFHKREGAVSYGEGSPPFSLLRQPFHGRSICRQLHSRDLSSQRRGHSISGPQFHSPAYPPMVGTPSCSPSSPVHHGKSQCSGRLSLSPEPDPGVGLDSPHGSLFGAPPPVASNDRPICYLSKSPLLHLLLALPRSSGDGDGRSATVLGSPPGLRVPSLGFDSTGPPQAPIVIQNCVDSDRPVLASEALVSGSAGPSNRPAGTIASSTRSPQPASLSASLSRAPQASSSCLATLQRFARAAGFSSRLAAQVGLARCSSSRTSYQLKWSVYRQWCRSVGHSVSRPSLPPLAPSF